MLARRAGLTEGDRVNVSRVPRLVAMITAAHGIDRDGIAAAVNEAAGRLSARLDGRAAVRGAVLNDDNPLDDLTGDRADSTADDAVIEITLREGEDLESLLAVARALPGDLNGVADAARSTLIGGFAYLVIAGDADIFVALAARRDPNISVEAMRRWWLEQHAELAKKIIRPQSVGYEQLHVERDFSRQACEAAGFAFEPFDLFDSINYHALADFVAAVGNPEIQKTLLEDEMGKVDHSRNRAAVFRVICRA